MARNKDPKLTRRERQIMDIVYARRTATVSEVLEALEDSPSYSAVRATMRTMVEKGHLKYRREGQAYVYLPTLTPDRARKQALRHMLSTFFEGSQSKAVAAILGLPQTRLSEEEYLRLTELLKNARREDTGS